LGAHRTLESNVKPTKATIRESLHESSPAQPAKQLLIEPLTRPAFGRVQTGYRRQRCDRFVRGANATVMSAMDYAQAVVLHRQAGERSNAAAQSNLGLMYRSVTKCFPPIRAWPRRAAGLCQRAHVVKLGGNVASN
jgi:TPR repeat protein